MLYTKASGKGYYTYFSHNPRTGGRYISNLLAANNYVSNRHGSEFFKMSEVMHLTIDQANEYYGINFLTYVKNSFVVVRDPVDRFISGSFPLTKLLKNVKDLESKEYFKYLMEEQEISQNMTDFNDYKVTYNGLKNHISNWFKKQSEFIGENTHIWKYENGLNDNFIFWLNDKVNIDIVNINVGYKALDYDKKDNKIKLTDKIAYNVIDYYQEDCQLYYGN